MTYQVLARKWRPKTFASLVGQEHVVRALSHALSEKRLHHAYLFTGTRGVGKTTLARILAKALNCEMGITATPCGICSACTEIDAGRFVDLLEVDAATNTRVDEMRQLLENAVYAPTRGRFKVYVIDEVHMLSNSAFNAMLKTLEEPPEHVKFILATTDPQKIPVTVLSRCLQFNLKQMPPSLIASYLKPILEVEGIAAETGALNLIARSAAGSMRDALSLLDQAIAHGAGKVEEAPVRDMLGTVDQDHLFSILDALRAEDASAMLRVANEMIARSLSFDEALQELASLLTRVQAAQFAPQSVADDDPDREKILEFATGFAPEFVQLAYQIAVHGRKELPLAPDGLSGFVMTLLRLHVFRPLPPGEAERGGKPAARLAAARKTVETKPATVLAQPETVKPITSPGVEKSPAPSALAAPKVQPDAPQRTSLPTETPPPVGVDWHALLAALDLGGMARELAQHCELLRLDETSLTLRLSPAHRHLQIKTAQDKLEQALFGHFQRPLRLAIELQEVVGETVAARSQRKQRERQKEAVASIEQDAFVREAIDLFDATLVESSIKPV